MQLIEQTPFGVRSAVIVMEKHDRGVRFVLFPMLHIGEPEFFAEVHRRLHDCDVVVIEGVGGRRTSVLTLAYRIAGRVRRDGLVDQGRGLDLNDLRDRLVRPDLNAAEFARGWRRVARKVRWLLYLAAPVFGLWMAVVGPRRVLGNDVAVEDLASRDEALLPESFDALQELLLDDRDKPLCEALARLAAQPTATTVGICYGAAHMRAVVGFLVGRLAYQVTGATWIDVMD